jgi:Cdc6-like AAA superfamily ATPase
MIFKYMYINYITLQWFLRLVAKIYNYFNKFIPPCMWSTAKTWLNLLMDDLEEHQKFEIKIHTII